MKYHNNLKTILITFFIVLLFLSVSVFLLSLRLTSPTMIITDSLMKMVSEADSDISLEFESLERNFRDRVMLNNLSLYYRGEKFASFRTVEVKLGLFDAISYILDLGGSAEVSFSDGEVTLLSSFVTSEDVKGDDSENKVNDFSLSSFLSSHNATLSFSNVLFSSDYASGLVDELYLSYLGREENFIGELRSDELTFSYDNLFVDAVSPYISFSYSDTFYLSSDFSSVKIEAGEGSALMSELSLSLTTPSFSSIKEGEMNARSSISSLSLHYASYDADLKEVELIYNEDEVLSVSVDDAEASSSSFSISLSSFEGVLDGFNSYSASLSKVKGRGADIPFDCNEISLEGSIKEKTLSFLVDEVSSNAGEYTSGRIGGIALSSLSGRTQYTDGLSLLLSLGASLETANERIDDISFSLDAQINVKDGVLTRSSLSVNDLYLGWGDKYDSLLTITGDLDNAEIKAEYGLFSLFLNASFSKRELNGDIKVDSLPVEDVLPLIYDDEIPLLGEESALSLSSSFSLSLSSSILGDISYSFSISPVSLPFFESYAFSSGELKITEDSIIISALKAGTSFFYIDASGSFDLRQYLPDIDFSVYLSGERRIMNGFVHLAGERMYDYYADFTAIESTYLSGAVDFGKKGLVYSSAILNTKGKERPFQLDVNLNDKKISLYSDKLSSEFDYSDGVKGRIEASKLETLRSDDERALVLDGFLDFSYSLSEGLDISSSTIEIRDIFLLPSSPTLTFSLLGSDSGIRLEDISLSFTDGTLLRGTFSCDFNSDTIAFALDEEGSDGTLIFSLIKDDDFTAVFSADNISLSALGMPDALCNINLYGRAKRIEDFSFTGNVDITSPSESAMKVNATLSIDSDSLEIENVVYSSDGINASLESLYFNSSDGTFGLKNLYWYLENAKSDRSYPLSASLSLTGTALKGDSLYSSLLSLYRNGANGVNARLSVDSVDIDSSRFVIKERYADICVTEDDIIIDGNFLTGRVGKEDFAGSVSIDLENIAVASFTFELSSSFKAKCDIKEFNMALVNLLMNYPTLVFRDDIVNGKVSITGEDGEFFVNGSLSGKELGVNIFWVEDQTVILHNPSFIIWDNILSSSYTYATVYDTLTSERRSIEMSIGVNLTQSLSMESWEVDIYIDEDNPVRVRIPLPHIGIDILGYVYGHYHAFSDQEGMDNEGSLILSDTVVSIGMNPYASWYDEITGPTFMDMTLSFGKNNRVLYPAGDDPIFSIDLQENSSVYAYMGHDGSLSFSGDIQIRGGEIYYFQKYFYITSGSIAFNDPNNFNPKINLRATLRDYSSSNEKAEIYLVLKDNTFDNLSPTLESSPVMELGEIMEILGQSILPSSTYGSVSVSSVASLVTEGFDILSRLGIVTSGNPLSSLSSSLKKVFGVDSFSLHSNILNNIVQETLSQATNSLSAQYSPMAKFLNGTTLNIGKYLTQNLYMQAMVHLEATDDKSSSTIISDDLALDTEFSLEWATNAFNVTFFTRPSYFSFDSLLSTFGFSITKTINF